MAEERPGREPGIPQGQVWTALMHELCSPLTVVVGRVQLLRRHLPAGDPDLERVEDDLEAIEGALVRLVAAVDRVQRSRLLD